MYVREEKEYVLLGFVNHSICECAIESESKLCVRVICSYKCDARLDSLSWNGIILGTRESGAIIERVQKLQLHIRWRPQNSEGRSADVGIRIEKTEREKGEDSLGSDPKDCVSRLRPSSWIGCLETTS